MTDSYVEYDFDPRNLPQEYLSTLGLIVSASSQTERTLTMAISACAGVDLEYGGAITTHMATPLKISVLKSVAEIRLNAEDLNELDTVLSAVDAAIAKRNIWAHCNFCRNTRTGHVFVIKETARTHYRLNLLPLTVDELKSEAALIYEAGMSLVGFLMRRSLAPSMPGIRDRESKTPAARKADRKKP